MKYYVAQSYFNDPMPVSQDAFQKTYLPAHQAFCARCAKEGSILLAGPKEGESGGFIIFRAQDREALGRLMAEDPFFALGIAAFEVKEFHPLDRMDAVRDW